MKNLIFSIAILTLLSCSTDHKNDWDELISDPLYHQLFESSISNSKLIYTKKVNPEKVYQTVDLYTSQLNYCDEIHKEKFSNEPDVIQFFENHCNMITIGSNLKNKYPFYSKLTREDIKEINDLYINTHLNGKSYYQLLNKTNIHD